MDILNDNEDFTNITDSISCLHALEHFGLGRYGEPIMPNGNIVGFNNIQKILKINEIFYLFFPIGNNEVYFNAHRIFSYNEILSWCFEPNSIAIERFYYENDVRDLILDVEINSFDTKLKYGCGINVIRKVS